MSSIALTTSPPTPGGTPGMPPPGSPPSAASPDGRARRLDPAVVRMALVLVLGAIAPLLDSTVVNVALHTLGRDFAAPVAQIQWVTTGYLLSLALVIPVTGWAADRFGAKRVWIAALLLFLGGSMLCALAWNLDALIAFRVVQGVGGGVMLPVLQTLLMRSAAGTGRQAMGRLMAVVTLPALVAPIFGPVVGGLIVGHASWRWIFLINAPICIAGALLAGRVLPADPPVRGARLDLPGLLLLSPAVAAVIYGLAQVGSLGGFGHPAVVVPLGAGVVLLAGFVARALRVRTPLVDLRLFRVRSFSASSGLLFLSGLSLYGSMLLLPLYYQQVRGASVIGAGLLMAPQGVGSLLARGAGALTDRVGPRPVLLAAIAATAVGTLPFVVAGEVNAALLAAALVLRGAGLSAANMAVMVGAYRDVDRAQIAHASTATRIAQQVGASFGTAVLAVILQRQLTAHPGSAGVRIAYGHTFLWALIFAAASVVPALLLPRAPEAERP